MAFPLMRQPIFTLWSSLSLSKTMVTLSLLKGAQQAALTTSASGGLRLSSAHCHPKRSTGQLTTFLAQLV